MPYTVAKAFSTTSRRFTVGASVSAADINGPTSFNDLLLGGFIVGSDTFSQASGSIASGQSLSSPILLVRRELAAIQMPTAWTAADITFQASIDGGATWAEMFTEHGVPVQIQVAASRLVRLDYLLWRGVDQLIVRSGIATAPVIQTAARAIVILLRSST